MFTRGWLNRGCIRSDEGFEVTLIGRSKVRYEQAGKSVDVTGELLADGFALEPATLCLWNDGTPVEQSQKREIIDRIAAALQSQGMTVDIV